MKKGTEQFKQAIKAYLDRRAQEDELFARSYAKEKKNLDECVSHVIGYAEQSGCSGFSDEEIYAQAVHYYDEDNLKVGKPSSAHVVVNHHVELTDEDKEQLRQAAREQVLNEEYTRLHRKSAKPAVSAEEKKVAQPTLF